MQQPLIYFRHLTATVAKSATVRKNKDRKL